MMLGQLDITCKKKKKNEIIPYLTLYTKIIQKGSAQELKLKFLEENIASLHNLGYRNGFLAKT